MNEGVSIGLGNIIAIGIAAGALLVSVITFAFTYRRTRKLEQFKIALGIMDKMNEGFRMQAKFYRENKYPKEGSEDDQRKWYEEFAQLLGFRQFYIRSLTDLVELKEITDPDIFNRCRFAVNSYLDYLDKSYSQVENSKFSNLMDSWPTYHVEVRNLKKIWEHKRTSRRKKISNRFKKLLKLK